MRISIVIPTYNGEQYIYDALKSACDQEECADEIIISDDASVDGTLDICSSLEFRNRVKIYENSCGPSGFVNAWNRAIQKAGSDYVTLLHQDDVLDRSYLRIVRNALRRHPDIGHVYCSCKYIDDNGRVIREPPQPYSKVPVIYTGKQYRHNYLQSVFMRKHIHRCPGVTTRKELLLICPYRKEAGHIADDDLFYRIGKHTNVIGINTPLAYYRHHGKSETGQLNQVDLALRLAQDYVFQSNFHSDCEYFDVSDVLILNRLTVHYINTILNFGLRNKNEDLIECAISFKGRIKWINNYSFADLCSHKYRLIWTFLALFHEIGGALVCADLIKLIQTLRRILHGDAHTAHLP